MLSHLEPAAGNDLIVEHIIEFRAWRTDLARLLDGLDVFLIGVHCDLAKIDRRGRARGDRRIGEGRAHVETDLIHSLGLYDLDLDIDTTHGITSGLTESAWPQGKSEPPASPAAHGARLVSSTGQPRHHRPVGPRISIQFRPAGVR